MWIELAWQMRLSIESLYQQMAGILFTDDKFVLAGYNPHKRAITGIGGKAKHNETPTQTAMRETIEELFELEEIPETLTRLLNNAIVFDNMMTRGGYTVFIMSFGDLDIILRTLHMVTNLKSNVYDVLPNNLNELIMNRKVNPNAELSHILLMPYEKIEGFSKSLINDIIHLKTVE
jgi:hypothetical protein